MSASSTVSDDYIKKQQELSLLSKQLIEQIALVSQAKEQYEIYCYKAIEYLTGEPCKKDNKILFDRLTAILEKMWAQIKSGKVKSLSELNFDDDFASLPNTYKSLIKFYFVRFAYEFKYMSSLLIKWDECAQEVNQKS
ncbi:hypothetical protein Noda2021_05630 [Candidatus Dependentiae bacterium Noda2021]|nr:hypothetical protein Noda2021_05630 [Candidatus Dependentiae bacterium Noda2021]